MKKTLILVVTLLFVVGVTGMAMAGVVGSKHDFSGSVTWAVTTGEVCKSCHAPHTTNTTMDTLLWNHDPSTTVNYIPYASSTLNDAPGQPDSHSKLCLSCHDGTVSINAFPGEAGTGPSVTGPLQIADGGDNLMGEHPVSMYYDALQNGGVSDPDLDYNITTISMGAATLDEVLPGGKVQCSTCHDVHNNTPVETVVGTKLLRVTLTGSAMCLRCHIK